MTQKLSINSVVIIKIPATLAHYSDEPRDMRCYVFDYNESQRSYTVLPIKKPYRYNKALSVREKAILEVVQVVTTSPKIENWDIGDALAFFSYEYILLGKAFTKHVDGPDSAGYQYDEYVASFRNFESDPTKNRLRFFLSDRKVFLSARNLPLAKAKKSRTVMRRLRKKSKMRNSNSSRSKNKQRTTYLTPTDIVQECEISIRGVSTKPTTKTTKTPVPSKRKSPQDLYNEIILGREQKKKEHSMPMGLSFSLNPPSKKKRKKKKQKLTMPF